MPVLPHKTQRVVADLFNVRENEAAAIVKPDGSLMPLADRARTKAAQHFVRIHTQVSVLPIDLERVASTRCADLDRRGAWS